MQITIHFLNGNSIDIQNHYFEKGYRDDIIIEIDTIFYDVHFFTLNSLAYEFTSDGFFSLPGMIILEEIAYDKILASMKYLVKIKYFEFFKGERILDMHKKALSNWFLNGPFMFKKESLFSISMPIET